jgi:hypothetical protein
MCVEKPTSHRRSVAGSDSLWTLRGKKRQTTTMITNAVVTAWAIAVAHAASMALPIGRARSAMQRLPFATIWYADSHPNAWRV